MLTLAQGCFVTHQKLPELGAGEVLMCDPAVTRIRFAAGERAFRTDVVEAYLTVTTPAPALPTTKSARHAKRKSLSAAPRT